MMLNSTMTALTVFLTSFVVTGQENGKTHELAMEGLDSKVLMEVIKFWKWSDFVLITDSKVTAICTLKNFPLKASVVIFPFLANLSLSLGSSIKGNGNDRLIVWINSTHLESILETAWSLKFLMTGYTWLFVVEGKFPLKTIRKFKKYLREDSIVYVLFPQKPKSFDTFDVYRICLYAHPVRRVQKYLIASYHDQNLIIKTSTFDQRDFKNYVATIGYTHYPPLVSFSQNGNDTHGDAEGYFPEIIKILSVALGFEYLFVHEISEKLGNVDAHGKWDGLTGLLQKKEITMALNLAMSSLRIPVADFSPSMLELSYKLVIKEPPESKPADIVEYLRPFTMDVWVFLLLIWLSATLCLTLAWPPVQQPLTSKAPIDEHITCNKIQQHDGSAIHRAFYLFFILWSVLLKQDLPRTTLQKNLPVYLVIVSFAIFAVVFINSYTCVLTAFTSIQRSSVPYNTLLEVLRSKKYEVGILQGGLVHQEVKSSSMGVMKELWRTLEHKPFNVIKSTSAGAKRLCREDFAFIDSILGLTAQGPTCPLRTIGKPILNVFKTIAFPKDSPFVEYFKRRLLLIRSSGVLSKLNQLFLMTPHDQYNNGQLTPGLPVTSLVQFYGILTLLKLGVIFSFTCLCFEKLANFSSKFLKKTTEQVAPRVSGK